MADNLIPLDLSRLTPADLAKVRALGDKLRLMHRWFRYEVSRGDDGGERVVLYSGDRGPTRYAAYAVGRGKDGRYVLSDSRRDRTLATARTIDAALEALPPDFFHARG